MLKAVRLVEDFEADGAGLAQVARSFVRFVDECGKDKPGALTAISAKSQERSSSTVM